jgi:hypothetical protein
MLLPGFASLPFLATYNMFAPLVAFIQATAAPVLSIVSE